MGVEGLKEFYAFTEDILTNSEVDYNSGILTYPQVSFDDFMQFCEVCKFGLDFVGLDKHIQLVYFHPDYRRDGVEPTDELVYGHLPPTEWYDYMKEKVGGGAVEDITMQDYQRRSPYPMINILRGEQLARATGGNSVVDLHVNGVVRKASGLSTYVRNGKRLEEVGRERLEELIRGDGTAQQTQGEQSAPATSTATATATATATLTRVWSEEYQRYYVYDPETNESTWE